ncbi:hypothetical protein GCM10025874_17470 [Arenivirga flava]|uniref:Uncharacterized protein n=1 Tax=Arenivirga flava TaxID=1930060 RepID=A0AA37UDP5_9MICO|nr:hypothetical protein GCM10025874_17470 [Arenivirga flava]
MLSRERAPLGAGARASLLPAVVLPAVPLPAVPLPALRDSAPKRRLSSFDGAELSLRH